MTSTPSYQRRVSLPIVFRETSRTHRNQARTSRIERQYKKTRRSGWPARHRGSRASDRRRDAPVGSFNPGPPPGCSVLIAEGKLPYHRRKKYGSRSPDTRPPRARWLDGPALGKPPSCRSACLAMVKHRRRRSYADARPDVAEVAGFVRDSGPHSAQFPLLRRLRRFAVRRRNCHLAVGSPPAKAGCLDGPCSEGSVPSAAPADSAERKYFAHADLERGPAVAKEVVGAPSRGVRCARPRPRATLR